MRLNFPNLTRPKKAAKAIADCLGVRLCASQRAVARICGYSDWHDLEKQHKQTNFALDQSIERSAFIDRQTKLTLALAKELGVTDSDAQCALGHGLISSHPDSRRGELDGCEVVFGTFVVARGDGSEGAMRESG